MTNFINAKLEEDWFFYPIDPTLPIWFVEEEKEIVNFEEYKNDILEKNPNIKKEYESERAERYMIMIDLLFKALKSIDNMSVRDSLFEEIKEKLK